MKILHYSDKTASNFLELYKECDTLISTGDLSLPDFAGLDMFPSKKTSFGVYGNHDSGKYLEELGIINLHNQVYDYVGLKWGGFQGCIKYKESGVMYTKEDAKIWADNFPYVDILLLHAGPLGMLDDSTDEIHKGNPDIARYVLEKKPKIVFCGHQYSDDFIDLGETKIYRTYGARIIEV